MKFSEDLVVAPLLDPSAAARLFPTLTPAQIARIAAHGTKRSMTAGEVLVEPGARPAPFLVVLEGELQILRPSPDGDELIVTLGPGQFGGETNLIVVVGGGNSAGQAAVFLAQTCRRVHMLVRGGTLTQTMSRYLIRRIEDSPTITLHTRTEVVALEGNGHLARVDWSSPGSNTPERHDIRHVFMMTGAVPNTRWVKGCVAMDEK
jgi:thioredoxin reductase (NADPH)